MFSIEPQVVPTTRHVRVGIDIIIDVRIDYFNCI